MALTGMEIEEICLALRSAFPSRSSLEQMVRFKLDKRLDEIVGNGAMQDVIFALVTWAEAQGRIPELLRGASASVNSRRDLESLASKYSGSNKNRLERLRLERLRLERLRAEVLARWEELKNSGAVKETVDVTTCTVDSTIKKFCERFDQLKEKVTAHQDVSRVLRNVNQPRTTSPGEELVTGGAKVPGGVVCLAVEPGGVETRGYPQEAG